MGGEGSGLICESLAAAGAIGDKRRMAIDLTPLHKAVAWLDVALTRYLRDPADEEVRDSVIQRFEFTYDLAHKMLRRVLAATSADAEAVARMTFPDLIRTGWEQSLIANGWPVWHDYRDMRNITSHTYDVDKAIQMVGKVPAFLDEARVLAERLERLAA
jgi:nucleotidyltransferase substrate binding protein (TIGR01987 family)